jgi:hypothetical protein
MLRGKYSYENVFLHLLGNYDILLGVKEENDINSI